jgi:hypothetical protein
VPENPNAWVPRCSLPTDQRASAAVAQGRARPNVSTVATVQPSRTQPKRQGEPATAKRMPRQALRLAM